MWTSRLRGTRASQHAGSTWSLSNDRNTYLLAHQDDRPYETDLRGYGRTFPHQLGGAGNKLLYTQIMASPVGDELLADFAKKLISNEQLGADEIPDYLSVSFSGLDAVDHFFGPSSLENEEMMLRLDRTLADLLAFVDREVGLERTLIVLSADHGMAELPEYMAEMNHDTGRLLPKAIVAAANRIAKAQFGLAGVVRFYYRPYVYLDDAAVTRANLDPHAVREAIAGALTLEPGIHLAVTADGLATLADSQLLARIRRNHHAARAGDIYVVQDPYWFNFDEGPVAAMHGSPWSYDTHVPIVFAGPGIPSKVVHRPVAPARRGTDARSGPGHVATRLGPGDRPSRGARWLLSHVEGHRIGAHNDLEFGPVIVTPNVNVDPPKEQSMRSMSITRGAAALTVAISLGGVASVASQDAAEGSGVSLEADRILRSMSKYLETAEALTFRAAVAYDSVAEGEQKLQYGGRANISVSRPGSLRVHYEGDELPRQVVIGDGAFAMLDREANVYVKGTVPKELGAALDRVFETYGISVPIADLLYPDPYETLIASVNAGTVVGRHAVLGTPCHHLAFSQETIDWQIWVEDGPSPLPRKLVITYRDEPGSPQYSATFSDWDLDPRLSMDYFQFRPPLGSDEIEILPQTEEGQ